MSGCSTSSQWEQKPAASGRDEENTEQELSSRLSSNKQQVFKTKGNCIKGSGMVQCVFAHVYDELSRGISPAVLQ